MKKITFLLTFLLTTFVGAWGQTGPNGSVKVTDAELTTGYYYLYNNGAAKYLSGSTGAYAWLDETALTDQVGLWYIQNRGAGTDGNIKYFLQAVGTSSYFGGVGPQANMNANPADNRISVRESGAYYTLSGHKDNTVGIGNYNAIQFASTTGNLLNRSGGTISESSFGVNSQWVLYKVTPTYNIVVTGTTDAGAGVQYDGNAYSNGGSFETSAIVSASDFTPNEVSGYTAYVKMNGTTIVVAYIENIDLTDLYVNNTSVTPTTDPIVEGQWYILSQVRDGETPAYDVGSGSTMKRAATSVTPSSVLTTNTPASDISQYMLRFIPTGIGNGYTIQFATGNFWNGVATTNAYASSGAYLLYNATHTSANYLGWRINATSDGTTYGSCVDNNAPGGTLAFWGSGYGTTGTNNVWKLYPVELGALISEVTYDVIVTDGTNSQTFSGLTSAVGTTITAGDFLSTNSQYVTSDSHKITLADNGTTITLNCTPNFPFTISADPSDAGTASYYYMTLRTTYCQGNVSSASTPELQSDEYLWAFGGDVFNGVTVYNKANGYMSVGSDADNSVATFSETPTYFTIQPNANETNGFNLNIPGTNAYINRRDGYVSTWKSSIANGEVGSCLVAIPEATVLANLINKLEDYFHTTDFVGALASADTAALRTDYEALKANPTKAGYIEFKASLDANLIKVIPGTYYLVQSAYPNFYNQQGNYKVVYYSASSGVMRWKAKDASPEYQVMQAVDNGSGGNVLYNPMAGVYLSSTDGSVTTDISSAKAFTLTALNAVGQFNVFLDGISTPLHTAGHSNGAGADGTLTNWPNVANTASAWYLVPQDIEEITLIAPTGVAEGEEVIQSFANATDAQLPTSIGVFTITEDLAAGAHLDTIASGKIAAGQGYLISGVKGATVPLLPVASAVEAPVGNLLVAGEGSVVNGGYILAYKKGDTEAKFYQINGLTVPENRSYLPEGTPTRGLEFLFGGLGDDVTGINGITTGAENGAIYDLQGRRVNNAQKGVYIINGKKVIK